MHDEAEVLQKHLDGVISFVSVLSGMKQTSDSSSSKGRASQVVIGKGLLVQN